MLFLRVIQSDLSTSIYTESITPMFHLCRKDMITSRFTFNFSSSGFLIESFNISLLTDVQWSIHKHFKKRQTCPFMNLSGVITILKENKRKILKGCPHIFLLVFAFEVHFKEADTTRTSFQSLKKEM